MTPTSDEIAVAKSLCIEMERLKERLFRVGLYKTAHVMDRAVKEVGFETAKMLERVK